MALLAAFATLSFLGVAPGPAVAAPDEAMLRLKAKAETCIRDNAVAVERSEQSLSEAAAFLVDYICVNEVRVFERYKTSRQMLAVMRNRGDDGLGWTISAPGTEPAEGQKGVTTVLERQKAMYKDASVDPDTGKLVFPASAKSDTSMSDFIDDLGEGVANSTELRAIAGRAVLDARQARLTH